MLAKSLSSSGWPGLGRTLGGHWIFGNCVLKGCMQRLRYASRIQTRPQVLLDLFIYSVIEFKFTIAQTNIVLELKCSTVTFCYRMLQGGCRKNLEQVRLVGGCDPPRAGI